MTPKKRFIQYLVLTLILFGAGAAMVATSHRSLEGLAVYEGPLTSAGIGKTRKDMSQPAIPIFLFTIEGLDQKFAIHNNYDYDVYLNNLKVGDKVKVYYDSDPYLTPEGYNQYVSQLEKGGVALLDINESNKSNHNIGYFIYAAAVIATIGTGWYFFTQVRVKG